MEGVKGLVGLEQAAACLLVEGDFLEFGRLLGA